ncbi:hypothetical protein AYI69_g1251 [Smittium culicis]|uniref:Reverse transcriptase domain-containing protein n=1 Tax=Smittium culicis TaxID=133412 RepID=A0A1R1YR55_9FUNG|nr:hypothetical protein AYI69_g1251 [Smittium culicis]
MLGDFNMETPASKKFALKLGTGFQHAKVDNSTGSRYIKNTVGRMIDHIYYAGLNSRPNWCTANRYLDLSDHMLITAQWNLDALEADRKVQHDKRHKKIGGQILNNDSKFYWRYIKSYTGKSFQSIADSPVYDKKLAKDTTGNSRSADKWENLISSDCDYYPEFDSTILWSDITDAPADTPKNKAPGADGVPSEVLKLVMAEQTPTSPLAKLIQKIFNLMYDIGGIPQCLETSVGMYDAPKIAVRVGNTVSKPIEYLFEVRQGFPASPILFDFYVNYIFKSVRGVWVPGLTSRIPGLLFADDAVLLAESSADLHAALDTIAEWSDTWEMSVNASKCGIISRSGEMTTDMTLWVQKVNYTDQYTYLGNIMNSKWSVSGNIKNNKKNVRKAVYAA